MTTIHTNKLPPEPAPTPVPEACRQPGVNNVEKYTRFLGSSAADPNLRLIVNAATILLIALAVALGGLSEAFAGFLLTRL